MEKLNVAVALYGSLEQAEQAITILRGDHFPLAQVSLGGKQLDHNDLGPGPRWAKCQESLSGSALFIEADQADIVVLGPLVKWIENEREAGASPIGRTALGQGLSSAGVPWDMVLAYEKAVGRGQVFLIAHGTVAEVSAAKRFLWRTRPLELDQYAAEAGTTLAGRSIW